MRLSALVVCFLILFSSFVYAERESSFLIEIPGAPSVGKGVSGAIVSVLEGSDGLNARVFFGIGGVSLNLPTLNQSGDVGFSAHVLQAGGVLPFSAHSAAVVGGILGFASYSMKESKESYSVVGLKGGVNFGPVFLIGNFLWPSGPDWVPKKIALGTAGIAIPF